MLQVGKHSDVKIATPVISEKGNLEVTLRQEGEKIDAAQALLNGDDVSSGDETARITFFPFQTTGFQDKELTADEVGKSIQVFRDQLNHMLVQGNLAPQYVKVAKKDRAAFIKDNIKWSAMSKVGVTSADQLLNQETLDKIFKAYSEEFIEKFVANEVHTAPLRAILVRRSANSHYPAFRKNFLTDQPIFERQDLIAEDKSEIRFSKYELEKGLDSAEPVVADVATDGGANSLFE